MLQCFIPHYGLFHLYLFRPELDCCSGLVCSLLPSSPSLPLPDSQLRAHHTHSPDFFSRLLRRSPRHSRELPEKSLQSRSYPLISPAHSSLRPNGRHHETRDCFWKYCDLCWKVSLKNAKLIVNKGKNNSHYFSYLSSMKDTQIQV